MIVNTDILSAKEQRAIFQQQLIKKYHKTLIVVRANYPGLIKFNAFSFYTVVLFKQIVCNQWSLIHDEILYSDEGAIAYCICDEDAIIVKKQCILWENTHPLGRLIDLDVISLDGLIDRSTLKVSPRKCFLCSQVAHGCVRSQNHSIFDLQDYFVNQVSQFVKKSYAEAFRFALLAEVACYPKFGLVTPFTSGIHKDMDISTFVTSTCTLTPYIEKLTTLKLAKDFSTVFKQLKELGLEMEKAMFQATNNVNTHKGAIFLSLLYLGSLQCKLPNQDLSEVIAQMSQPLWLDFGKIEQKERLSTGEQWYKKQKVLGIRGFALSGMKALFDDYVPFFENQSKSELSFNDVCVKTLLYIMSTTQDTTVLKRVGFEGLRWVQDKASLQVYQSGKQWLEFEKTCIDKGISCGGSADILMVVLLHNLMQTEN